MVSGFLRAFSTRASSSRNAALDPPSLAPTNRNCAEQLRVVVAGDDDAVLAARRESWRSRFTMWTLPSGVWSSHACSTTVTPTAASCSLMYLRVCSMAGEPAGRGPIATSCRRCSQARLGVELRRRPALQRAMRSARARDAQQSSPIMRSSASHSTPVCPAGRSRAAPAPV